MTSARSHALSAAALLFLSLGGSSLRLNAQAAPDNSAQNKVQPATAQNQGTDKADRMTTAQIRRAIIADKALSLYAHNVKIITRDGAVTLTGPVKSEDEKTRVAADAANIVSPEKISNQLTVKQ